MYKRILVPLDGSEFAEASLPHVRTLAKCTGAEIVLLRVVVRRMYEHAVPEPIPAEFNHESEKESEAYLERVASELREAGLKVTTETCIGPVAEAILEYAEGIHADLIAMSTHGRSGLARWFIGSVADKVVRGSKLPVLLTRPTILKN